MGNAGKEGREASKGPVGSLRACLPKGGGGVTEEAPDPPPGVDTTPPVTTAPAVWNTSMGMSPSLPASCDMSRDLSRTLYG